jgi:hypothetical protein
MLVFAVARAGEAQSRLNEIMPADLNAELARIKARPVPAPRGDLAVVFWCDWRDPLATLKYQVYDVRKGEYTEAVADWMEMVSRSYPDYAVFRRDVNLGARKRGPVVDELVANERKRMASAETMIAAARAEAARRTVRGASEAARSTRARSLQSRATISLDSVYRATPGSTYLFPTPMPHPKPHP